MCGFAGFVGNADDSAPKRIEAALQALAHRGPDGYGTYSRPGVWLAHTRLAFLDLSERGRQPMADASGRYVLVFNGEIYNFQELYKKYCTASPGVNRLSDTSVLLDLYVQFGSNCLPLLNGMFAFAVFDRQERTVFLARDRFGEKPIYWVQNRNGFAFASELQTLRRCFPDWPWKLSRSGHACYLVLGNIPAPHTVYEGVTAVPPGSWVCWSEAVGATRGSYWSLARAYASRDPSTRSPGEVREQIQTRLLKSVRSRLVSDVPVGLFLSGGLDSGSLLGLCTAIGQPQEHALCIDFSQKEFSEYALASKTASHYGARLHRVPIELDSFHRGIEEFFRSMDQPTSDGYNTYFLCQAAKSIGVKAWLSGVGGDELFGGYRSFRRLAKLRALAGALQAFMPLSIVETCSRAFWSELRLPRVLHLSDPGVSAIRAHQALRGVVPWRNARLVTKPKFAVDTPYLAALDNSYPDFHSGFDAFQWASVCESTVYMGSQLLRDMDNFSMRFSLELRAPFLDHELFEQVFSLPRDIKMSGPGSKPLLCSSIPKPLPEEIVNQPKRGFTFPVALWLKKGLAPSPEEVLQDHSMSDLWDQRVVSHMLRLFRAGRVNWGVVWTMYAFSRWRAANGCEI